MSLNSSDTESITLKLQDFIPLSKTIIKDCTLLELQSGEDKLQNFLLHQNDLSEDVLACLEVLTIGRKLGVAKVRNFRSLLIGLKMLEIQKGIKFDIVMGNQLSERELDPQSSQWESAKVCCGLQTFDSRYHVEIAKTVVMKYNQGYREELFDTKDEVYLELLEYVKTGMKMRINNPEIAVFYAIFHPEELPKMVRYFPTWKHHESDRSKSILEALEQFLTGKLVKSNDHRIVIGIALLAYILDENVTFLHYSCTWKSFPKFFDMLEAIKNERKQ